MPEPAIRHELRLPIDLSQDLEELVREKGTNKNALITDALRLYLRAEGIRRKQLASAGSVT